jgi:hypothetical protein
MAVTLFPDGVSNALLDSFGARVPMPWPPQYYTFFDDFDGYRAGASLDWLATITGTGTAIVSDALGGVVNITNSGADDDAYFAQWQGGNGSSNIAETFTFRAGKKLWFAARFQLSDVTDSDAIIGLAIADTSPLDASDGVFFLKADDAATLALVSKIVTPVTASVNVLTMVAATYYEVAFEYDGIDTIKAFVNGNPAGSLGITALPTTELAVTFGVQNGAAAAKTMLLDWIFCATER